VGGEYLAVYIHYTHPPPILAFPLYTMGEGNFSEIKLNFSGNQVVFYHNRKNLHSDYSLNMLLYNIILIVSSAF